MSIEDFIHNLGLDSDDAQKVIDLLRPWSQKLVEESSFHGVNSTTAITKAERAVLASYVGKIALHEEGGGWIGPSSERYITACEQNWSATCHMYPQCILSPANSQQVGQALTIAQTFKVPFAVRSGGHNPNRGWASADKDEILIDMNKLQSFKLSEDKRKVTFGPGGRWQRIYEQLHGTGVSVIGGRTGDVGIGGLVLGGGLPSFSSEYGLVCDNVDSFEVVLADSSVVNANRKENPDLFWALKGGGSNYGIVTQFTFNTVPIDKIWFEVRLYDPSSNEQIFKAIEQYQKLAESEPQGSIVHQIGHKRTLLGWIYSKPVEYPALFKIFYTIPYNQYFVKSTIGTVLDFSKKMSKVLGPPMKMRRNAFGIATKPSAEFYNLAYQRWRMISDNLLEETGCDRSMGIQPLTTSAVKKGTLDRGNALNVSVEPQQWLNSLTQWVDEKDDRRVLDAVYKFGDYLHETATEMAILLPFIFMNDATASQSPIASYGMKNVARLKEVSDRYDPNQVFQTLQRDGFLLRKVG